MRKDFRTRYNNFLSPIFYTDEAKFHISGRASQLKYVIWGGELPREHLEHARSNPEVNMWCARISSRRTALQALPDMLENGALPQLNNKILFFNLTIYLFIFLTFSATVWKWIPRSTDRNRRITGMASSFFWSYAFGTVWKTRCTAREWTRWMNAKYGSQQQLQMLQVTCYSASGMYVEYVQRYIWCSLWSVSHLTTWQIFIWETVSIDE
jgi:hypothetical protein